MFNFRLQTLLDVRKTYEDKALAEFSEQQREYLLEQEALKKLEAEKVRLINLFRELQGRRVNIYDILLKSSNIKQCQKKEHLQRQRVDEVKQKVDEKRAALLEATQKRKMMDILKSKDFEKFKSDEDLLERSFIDEMSIVRHNRREKT